MMTLTGTTSNCLKKMQTSHKEKGYFNNSSKFVKFKANRSCLTQTGEMIAIVKAAGLLVGAHDVHVTFVSQSVDVALSRGPAHLGEVPLAPFGGLVEDLQQLAFTPRAAFTDRQHGKLPKSRTERGPQY